MRRSIISIAVLLGLLTGFGRDMAMVAAPFDINNFHTAAYTVEEDAFVSHNTKRFNNRPLYCNQISSVVLAGDQPHLRFGNKRMLDGSFVIAFARGDQAKWLHDCSDITSKYRPGRMEWIIKDEKLFGATVVRLEAVTPAEKAGMAVRCRIEGARPGDRLIWACGGSVLGTHTLVFWDIGNKRAAGNKMALRFSPEECKENRLTQENGQFVLRSAPGSVTGTTIIRCSAAGQRVIADAGKLGDPLALAASSGGELPVACGVVEADKESEIYWAMQSFVGKKTADAVKLTPPAEFFSAGMERVKKICRQVIVDTPDPWLNAAVPASSVAMDGVFRDGIFTHAGMRWGVPLIGWRSIFGGTVYGWHDRVLAQAKTCLAKQITKSSNTKAEADPQRGLASQSPNSRVFGKGRVDIHNPHHYDMQTQFFDQLIHAWRWTGDAELEKILRPALELHCEYIHDCFDPDDDGLYESYTNTFPTDNQWYNGGGTSEETAYAYTAHKAALEMARRAGDSASVKRHEAKLAQIQKSFFDKLWIPEKGHPGAYVEQGGHQRVHEDCWLYAIFCPIDAGLLPTDKAAQALYFTEWGLERQKMSYGGQLCWPSNWVPSAWSLRQLWPGDIYHLAMAYYQTGLADDGWELLRGTFPLAMLCDNVPGDMGYVACGTDFTDCASTFCRTVVEGLFGYQPDYPNGVVVIAPKFPSNWDHASIRTPDASIAFKGNRYEISLASPAKLDVRLPVRAKTVTSVVVNGRPVKWELQPGYGCSEVRVQIPSAKSVVVEVACGEPLPQFAAPPQEINLGETVKISMPDDAKLLEDIPSLATPGYHLIDVLAQTGRTTQRRLFKVKVNDHKGDALVASKNLETAPADAKWLYVDMNEQLNGDIRQIFQQKYLSPRPNTCSLRLAVDGYSTWMWKLSPARKLPKIKLDQVPKYMGEANRMTTPQGSRFAWPGGEKNIAFTSLWDNWPRSVTVPVNATGDSVWFLVCGSTNPMQCRIENAELRIQYADGEVEKLALTPPLNFWSLCGFMGADYDYSCDAFALPKKPPLQVQLGENCRAMVYGWKLRPGVTVKEVTLETLSQEVVIGLMGMSVCNPKN